MKVDVVYPLAVPKRPEEDFELRYSLRSLDCQDWVRDVILVGHLPSWVRGIRHIECDDPFKAKDRNIIRKILTACGQDGISDTVVVNSDDHYINRPIDLEDLGPFVEFPDHHDDSVRRYLVNTWCRRSVDTVEWCRRNGHPPWVFQAHIPYPIKVQEYVETMARVPWEAGNGLVTHVYYNVTLAARPPDEPAGMTVRLVHRYLERPMDLEASTFINHNNPGLLIAKPYLVERFPEPSRWEA